MKIKNGFILRNIADIHMVVPIGARAQEFRGMITLSETRAFMWRMLETPKSYDELLAALAVQYELDEGEARYVLDDFLVMVRETGALEE